MIVEEYIGDDFRFEGSVHCRNGQPKIISVIDRHSKERQSFGIDKTPLGVSLGFPLREMELKDWRFYEAVIEGSKVLSQEFNYIRVDFYTDGENILFGELTNLPAGGNGRFYPKDGEEKFSKVFFSHEHE